MSFLVCYVLLDKKLNSNCLYKHVCDFDGATQWLKVTILSHLNTLHLYPVQTQKRTKKKVSNFYIKLLTYQHPIV